MAVKQVTGQWNLNQSAVASMHEAISSQRFRSFPMAAKKNEEFQNKIPTLLVLFLPKPSLISPGLVLRAWWPFYWSGEAICDLLWGVLEVVEDLWLGGSLLIHHNHHHHSRRRRFEPQSTEEKRRKEIFGAFSTEAGAKVFVVKQPTKREKKNA